MPRNSETTESAPHDEIEPDFAGQVTEAEMDSAPPVDGRNASLFDNAELRNLTSFADAVAMTESVLGSPTIDAHEEIGSGFTVLEKRQKDQLLGVKFLIMVYDFNRGDKGWFVSMQVVTESGGRFIVNDGSSGIYDQLREFAIASGRKGGIIVNRGLRRSDYPLKDEDGNEIVNEFTGKTEWSATYYLNV